MAKKEADCWNEVIKAIAFCETTQLDARTKNQKGAERENSVKRRREREREKEYKNGAERLSLWLPSPFLSGMSSSAPGDGERGGGKCNLDLLPFLLLLCVGYVLVPLSLSLLPWLMMKNERVLHMLPPPTLPPSPLLLLRLQQLLLLRASFIISAGPFFSSFIYNFCFVLFFFKNCYSVSKSVCRSIIFFRLFAVFKLLSSGFRRAPACHQKRLDLFLVTHSGSAKLSRNSFIYLFIPFRVVDVPIAVFKDETKTRGLSSLIIRAL